ncbi:WW domain binding protein 1-like [Saccostrea cucullata]|uniref:WW domain binding protein 1-like n=1 Tax=Saccostrea cuccullata TaxID=36930 RepID=UPI002ED0D17C
MTIYAGFINRNRTPIIKMDATRIWSAVFGLLAFFCQTISGFTTCWSDFNVRYYCSNDQYCCGNMECCTHYYVYQLWWFWFIWVIIFLLIVSCIIGLRRRRNRLQYIRVAQPVYGTSAATTATTAYPPAGAYQQPPPTAPAYPPQYSQKPPPYQ